MRIILARNWFSDADRCTDPDPLLGIAINRHGNNIRRSAKGKATCRPICPMKEAGRSDEEHTSDAIFGEGRCDVAGDHTGFGKDLNFSVNETLYTVVSCNPKHASSVLVHRANPLVQPARARPDIVAAGRTPAEDSAPV